MLTSSENGVRSPVRAFIGDPQLTRLHLVFPGGFLPTWTFMTNSIHQGTNARMIVDDVANIGVRSIASL